MEEKRLEDDFLDQIKNEARLLNHRDENARLDHLDSLPGDIYYSLRTENNQLLTQKLIEMAGFALDWLMELEKEWQEELTKRA